MSLTVRQCFIAKIKLEIKDVTERSGIDGYFINYVYWRRVDQCFR